jgi:hypothetical protein
VRGAEESECPPTHDAEEAGARRRMALRRRVPAGAWRRGGGCPGHQTSAALEAKQDAAEPVALGRQRCIGEPAEGDGASKMPLTSRKEPSA